MIMAKKKTDSHVKRRDSYPERTKDVPANLGTLYIVRDELKSDVSSLQYQMNARFSEVDSRLSEMLAKMHQMHLLAEEQNSRNKIVLDGLTSLFSRQERIEKKLGNFKWDLPPVDPNRPHDYRPNI